MAGVMLGALSDSAELLLAVRGSHNVSASSRPILFRYLKQSAIVLAKLQSFTDFPSISRHSTPSVSAE